MLASGDPMLSGVGSSLVRLHGAGAVEVLAHPSSVTLACARLGWAVEETQVVPVVGRPVELIVRQSTASPKMNGAARTSLSSLPSPSTSSSAG